MRLLRTSAVSLAVRPSFFVLAFLLAIFLGGDINAAFLIMGILFLVFFLHEVGHVFVARLLGRPCDTVIGGAGGTTEVYGPLLKCWQRIAILAGGIVVSYLAMLGSGIWIFSDETLSATFSNYLYLFYALNVGWFWCNLLPLYPFDGGEIALDIGGSLFGRFGQKAVALLSIVLSIFFAMYLLAGGMLIGMILCFYCLTQSFVLFRHPAARRRELSEEALHVHELRQRWLAGEQDEVIRQMQQMASDGKEKEVRQEALECGSSYLLAADRPRDAFELLIHAKDPLVQPALEHLQLAAYRTSHWQEGLEAGREAFRECQTLPVATMCALLAARLGLEEESIAWLRTAERLGVANIAAVVESDDFDPIRSGVEFQAFVTRGL